MASTQDPAAPTSPADDSLSLESVERAWLRARQQLLAERTTTGHWVGQLSTSALSTATAISGLALVRTQRTQSYLQRRDEIDQAIAVACRWLLGQQNADGGFGDTNLSHSNIATSLLVLAAWQLAEFNATASDAVARGWAYCDRVGKWDALRRRYGKDKTFVAPILTNCALAGIVAWDDVPTLPFEAAWLPQSWYRLARMPVVSYAIPALVAIGQAKFHHRPPSGPLRTLRRAAIEPTLRVLGRMQPASGGYLEAVPLTSFVLMCLADIGRGDHPVAARAVDFLLASRLDDGSLPIDTNLATWTTSLSISALHYGKRESAAAACDQPHAGSLVESAQPSSAAVNGAASKSPAANSAAANNAAANSGPLVSPSTIRWLLACQHWSNHPFTGAKPGGWGWSNLSGAVPDADDTPAALLALARWFEQRQAWEPPPAATPILDAQISHAAAQGLQWLLNLQNRDGGWPTFCRGWGKLPFDRSGSDLTAHALRALEVWRNRAEHLPADKLQRLVPAIDRAATRGFRFLAERQNADGSWFPLWFGNQDRPDEENPVYGTAKVLLAYAQCRRADSARDRGTEYLVQHQNADGGWGGGASVPYRAGNRATRAHGSSVEETGAALEALLACRSGNITNSAGDIAGGNGGSTAAIDATIMRGLRWLVAAVETDCSLTSWPIGFYFAKLWYHERLYPIIASTAALGAAVERPELWWKSP